MKNIYNIFFLLFTVFFLTEIGFAQKSVIFKGIVEDDEGVVPFAYVFLKSTKIGTVTNNEGEFSVKIPSRFLKSESFVLEVSLLGYITEEYTVYANQKTDQIKIELTKESKALRSVEIIGEKYLGETQLNTTQMSTIQIKREEILAIPALFGEVDVLKTMQLLPGTTKGVEGSTDFFVRGGDADQNLLLFDGATVYNSGHLFGFLSVFNPGVVDDVKMIKGAFPAQFGGRLSSIIDVNTPTSIVNKFNFDGSVGLISSNLTLRTPVIKNKLSFIGSFRRTYIDKILEVIDNPEAQLPYYFYDVNFIANWKPTSKTSISFSTYQSDDVMAISRNFKSDDTGSSGFSNNFNLPGNSLTLRARHQIDENSFLKINASRTGFTYSLSILVNNRGEIDEISAGSSLVDYDLKTVLIKKLPFDIVLNTGFQTISHDFAPIEIKSDGLFDSFLPSNKSDGLQAYELALFASGTKSFLNKKILLTLGYRQSISFNTDFFYQVPEPRIALKIDTGNLSAVKASYSRTGQYVHRVSSNSVTLPLDLWYTVSPKIKPQYATQWAIGYSKAIKRFNLFFETEMYYKTMQNITSYKEGTSLLFNTEFEASILQGLGTSYGIELLTRHKSDKISGWISYTYSHTNRFFEHLNNGVEFPAKYDRRHNVAIVSIVNIGKRWKFSAVWEYLSGSRYTAILGQYLTVNAAKLGLDLENIFSQRNQLSLSDSHRLDLSLSYVLNKGTRWIGELQLSFYNVYNNSNPVNVSLNTSRRTGTLTYQETSLFGFLPSISYKFKFK